MAKRQAVTRKEVLQSRVPVGFGFLKHRPKPIRAPHSFAGRRDASHGKAYQDER